MTCVICKQGEVLPGRAELTLRSATATVVFRNVPARICQNCGEEYLDEEVTARLLQETECAARSGVELQVRAYVAA